MFTFITKVFADGGYQGERVAALLRDSGQLDPRHRQALGRRQGHPRSAQALDRSTNAGVDLRCRRLAGNLENLARTSLALIRLAMIKLITRRDHSTIKLHRTTLKMFTASKRRTSEAHLLLHTLPFILKRTKNGKKICLPRKAWRKGALPFAGCVFSWELYSNETDRTPSPLHGGARREPRKSYRRTPNRGRKCPPGP